MRLRCSLGRRWAWCLGQLGDPRIYDLRDPRAYIEVPAGIYRYGEKKGRTVKIAAPFLLGRYPVTNSQYRAFVEDGGYRKQEWWSDAGWNWLRKQEVTEPWRWRDRRWNSPNQPVVGVSFWEAEACCAWAGGRLPREEEWEAAAGGPEGNVYPWGNDWEDGICNSVEVGLGVTSPVGLFPRSRQAELGIEDLAGNVLEWCAAIDDHPENAAPGKHPETPSAVCGGAWPLPGNAVRSNVRVILPSKLREQVMGFRVVCSSRLWTADLRSAKLSV